MPRGNIANFGGKMAPPFSGGQGDNMAKNSFGNAGKPPKLPPMPPMQSDNDGDEMPGNPYAAPGPMPAPKAPRAPKPAAIAAPKAAKPSGAKMSMTQAIAASRAMAAGRHGK